MKHLSWALCWLAIAAALGMVRRRCRPASGHGVPLPRSADPVHRPDHGAGSQGQGLPHHRGRADHHRADRQAGAAAAARSATARRRARGRSARVDPQRQRAARQRCAQAARSRVANARKSGWPTLQREFNNGEPERLGSERNYQKYLDRVADMRAAITRKEERHRGHQARARQAADAVTRAPRRERSASPAAATDATVRADRGAATGSWPRPALRGLRPAGHAGCHGAPGRHGAVRQPGVRGRRGLVAARAGARPACSNGSPTPRLARHAARGGAQRNRHRALRGHAEARRQCGVAPKPCRCT